MASKLIHEKIYGVSEERQQMVAQYNDFIRHPRNQLTAQEQNIVYFLISKIKPADKDFMEVTISISEFCSVCGMDYPNGKNHNDVKSAISSIKSKNVWVEISKGVQTVISWIDTATVYSNSGIIKVRLSYSLKPFLLDLIGRGNYTQAELINFLALRSKYGKRLYEILKSHCNADDYRLANISYDMDELKELLNAEKYKRYPDFQRYVLDIATREIEKYTDVSVGYSPIKTGRKFTGVSFTIRRKKPHERMESYSRATASLDGLDIIDGQMDLTGKVIKK